MGHGKLGTAPSRTARRKVKFASHGVMLACLLGAATVSVSTARADEFSTIPPGNAIYTHLTTLRQGPWSGESGVAPHSLTRYEVAIETAKAILKVNAQRSANPGGTPASRSTLRALKNLTIALRPELSRLDIDVPGTLRLLDELTNLNSLERTVERNERPLVTTKLNSELSGGGTSVAQRLRVYSALSAVARDTSDPFGDNTDDFTPRGLLVARPGIVGSAVSGAPSLAMRQSAALGGKMETGAALGLTNWMQLRAGYGMQRLTPDTSPWNGLRAPLLEGAREARSLGTGVDIALPLGMTLSGDVARVSALNYSGEVARRGTRYGGGLNLSAWENRLSLSANLSRLVPEDSGQLSSTATEFNLGVGVTERLQLTLDYQKMFSARRTTGSERTLSGGISVKF